MITETSGFNYLDYDCGYIWIPSTQRGLEKGSSRGKAIAVILDDQVVATFSTYPPLWDAMNNGALVDVSDDYSFPETESVINIVVNELVAFTLHISNPLLAAALASNPILIELTNETAMVTTGWRYENGKFIE